MPEMKLYHNEMSVCAQKVRLALAELGLKLKNHHLKLRGDEQLHPDHHEIACRSLGINTKNTKLTAFALGAFFGGLAGSFFAVRQGFISPESFT